MIKYFLIVAAIMLVGACGRLEFNKANVRFDDDNMVCHWMSGKAVCFCIVHVLMPWGSATVGSHMPDRVCDGDETGAVP